MTSTTATEVRAAAHVDVTVLTAVLTDAFFTAPDVVWLMPEPSQRATVLPRIAQALLRQAIDTGTVHTTAGRDAAAIWWPPGTPDPQIYQRIIENTCDAYAPAILGLGALLTQAAPQTPHHYLAYLGVHPDWQRNGTGSQLLRHQHQILDRSGHAAYLVATTLASRDLYQRHGYQPHTPQPLQAAAGPPLWPMWRKATAAALSTTDPRTV